MSGSGTRYDVLVQGSTPDYYKWIATYPTYVQAERRTHEEERLNPQGRYKIKRVKLTTIYHTKERAENE